LAATAKASESGASWPFLLLRFNKRDAFGRTKKAQRA
jgi:hypothetical protein